MIVDLDPGDDALLERFYRSIYWDEFADQHEPLDTWRAALRAELPYELIIKLAVDGDTILGGIAFERYPRSGCGLVTYMVVAPAARRGGLGKQLLTGATADLHACGAPAVFGEVNDPRVHGEPAWPRLERNQRWGARVLAMRYVQPALGPGLSRDRGLVLIAMPPLPDPLPGAVVRDFLDELYTVTEGGPLDPEIAVPDEVPLVELRR
ncbi:MAG: GNAT family N-acetyltransferase [Kofleriaceae bacterium]